MKRQVLGSLLLLLLALFLAVSKAEGCQNAPTWLFALPEDLEPIFGGLEDPVIIVEEGEVNSLLLEPAAVTLFALPENVPEFPIVWCSTGDERINYTLVLSSDQPDNLSPPLLSIPSQGVVPRKSYRFHVCFPCHTTGPRSLSRVTVNFFTVREDGVEYCPVQFFFSKFCGSQSINHDNCSVSLLNFEDGPVNTSGILNKNNQNSTMSPPPPQPTRRLPLDTILPSIIIPIAILALLLTLFVIWLVWYRRRSKAIATFQPEAVSLAYQGVYTAWNQRQAHEKEFPLEKLTLVRELGEGAFGVVHEAKADGIEEEGVVSIVAVKQLRGDCDAQLVDDFFREVDFMSRLEHTRIVRLLGVCSQQEPFSMIFEYMDLGDLRSFLRDAAGLGMGEEDEEKGIQDNPMLTMAELLTIAVQVAEGMVYISSKHLVHRDLATRNCLVATGLVVKIADFGMSRDVYSSDYYRVHGSAMLPVRWMPPESILYGKFSTRTDTWAFGILLWEIFNFGQQPYTGLTNEEVIACVEKGGHPEPPEGCPTSRLMMNCWKLTPKARPSFEAISATLQTLISSHE